jgi:predicted nucleic acid-binding protein
MKTGGSAKVLVDTSAWISFFRKETPNYPRISELIDEDRVACCGLILAELVQGVKSEKELAWLDDFLMVFEFPVEPPILWRKAGELSFRLRKSGKSVDLADCYIATLAGEMGYSVLTLDRHFLALAKETGIKLI